MKMTVERRSAPADGTVPRVTWTHQGAESLQPDLHSDPAESALLLRLRDEVRKRHYSVRTEDAYADWIIRFLRFHGNRDPRSMGKDEVERFLSCLAVEKDVAASTQNQAFSALLFLYRYVLDIRLDWLDGVVRAKRPKRLPVVLTRDEVAAVLKNLRGKNLVAAMLMYGAGLRLLECLELRIKDIDFGFRQITIREGKGNKDRVTVLPVAVEARFKLHIDDVRVLHEKDLKEGGGYVKLPKALWEKHLNADRSWGWQWVFPAHRQHSVPETGVNPIRWTGRLPDFVPSA